jgi:hypothetical protein
MHQTWHDGAHGGDPLRSNTGSPPLGKKRRCHQTTPDGAPPRPWWCTSSVTVPRPSSLRRTEARWAPRGGGATGHGMAVLLGQHPEPGFAFFLHGSTSPLQMCQHHKCFTITCKCVSIFINIFPKELATRLATPLDPSNDAKLDHSSSTR